MAAVEESIELNVPVQDAYTAWSRFEEFPDFMDGVKDVEQLDSKTLRWELSIAGQKRAFEATITQQIENECIAWKSDDYPHAGTARFEVIDEGRSRLTLRVEYEPQGALEKIAEAGGIAQQKARSDLERFRKRVEK